MSYDFLGEGEGLCALGAPRRRQREAAAHAAPHLPRGLDDSRARLRRLEVGLEEEVEERRGALEVHEEERDGELDLRGSSSASPWNLISTRGSTLNGTHQQTGTSWWSDARTK